MEKWNKPNRPVILASQSPRRKDIMEQMGFEFTVKIPASIDERSYIHQETLIDSIQALAMAKAETISSIHPEAIVLGSDTLVVLDNRVLSKPDGYDDALAMLRELSGRRHTVYTGVALICQSCGFRKTVVEATEVIFRSVDNCEIEEYLATTEYKDKAGAYAIQGKGMSFIRRINGCFYNVMGLPVTQTITLFEEYLHFMKGLEQ